MQINANVANVSSDSIFVRLAGLSVPKRFFVPPNLLEEKNKITLGDNVTFEWEHTDWDNSKADVIVRFIQKGTPIVIKRTPKIGEQTFRGVLLHKTQYGFRLANSEMLFKVGDYRQKYLDAINEGTEIEVKYIDSVGTKQTFHNVTYIRIVGI